MTEVIRGRYQLIDKLGQGGFGSVWRAHDNTLNREVAVKVLNLANENQEEMVARFKTESQVASSFEHPNILRVYDFGQDENGRCFLVSELLKGVSLHDKLKPKESLPIELCLDVLYQVGSALEVAHAQKTVHRDIKPPNIFLNQPMKGPGFVKLLDFGIAKVIGGKQESLTVTGQIMGTPHYMSPEQIVNIKLVDHRSDIYSLGIVFYHMLMGVVPFDDESYFSIMRHQMQSPMPKLELPQYSSNLVAELQEILKLMTHKDVRKRVSEMKEILGRIERIWQVYSVSSNALTTGSFRAISLAGQSINQSKTTVQKADPVFEQMLDLAEDQNADALIDDMFAVNKVDSPAPSPSDEPQQQTQAGHQPDFFEEVPIADPSSTDETPVSLAPAQSVQVAPAIDANQVSEDAHEALSKEVISTSAHEENFEAKQNTQALKKLTESSSFSWPLLIASVLTVVLVAWFISTSKSSDHSQNHQQDPSAAHILKLPVDASLAYDLEVKSTQQQAVVNDQEMIADQSVSQDQSIIQDQSVSQDQSIIQDQSVSQDQELASAKPKTAKTSSVAKAKTTKAKKNYTRSKLKTKKKRPIKRKKKRSKPKVNGRVRIIPDGVSYDVGQKVRLKLPSSTKGLKGTISLGSCARWLSKSKNKIEFIKAGKCTIKACYGKDCIKSSVINVTKPLF